MKHYRILHVLADMDPKSGGVCQAVKTMIIGLNEIGILNEVACLDDPYALYLEGLPFPVHALGPAKGPWAYSKKIKPWLIDNLHRFETVIIHGLWLFHGYSVRKAMNELKRRLMPAGLFPRVFVMPHGMLDPYFQQAQGRKLKAIRNQVYWKLIEGRLVNEASGLLFTCEEECRLAYQPFRPYKPVSEAIVGLGIQRPPAFSFEMQQAFLYQCPQLQGCSYFLFLSRLDKKKGLDLLINAYSQLQVETSKNKSGRTPARPTAKGEKLNEEKNANHQPHLVIAGPGLKESYGRKMQQLANSYPESRNLVHFVDMLSGDAKWGAFYGCEAFILPSHQENFGIAVVEALACSKAVLISNQVNIFKEIEAAGAGLVEADTVTGTKKLLQRWLCMSGKDRNSMNRKSKKLFETHFSIARTAVRIKNAIAIP